MLKASSSIQLPRLACRSIQSHPSRVGLLTDRASRRFEEPPNWVIERWFDRPRTHVSAPPAAARRPFGPGAGRALEALGRATAAHRAGRPRGQVDLSLLRRGLRAGGLRARRAGHPDRGRPRLADLAWSPVPKGV